MVLVSALVPPLLPKPTMVGALETAAARAADATAFATASMPPSLTAVVW